MTCVVSETVATLSNGSAACTLLVIMERDDILKLAALARLELTNEELERFPRELNDILEYVSQLEKVDVTDVEPTGQILGLSNVLRKDEPRGEDIEELRARRTELLAMAPETENGYLVVPKVLDRGDE